MKFRLMVIDGRNLLWRMHATHRNLSAVVGGEEMQTGGMYGFLATASRIYTRHGARIVVAWEDKRRRNFRSRLWPDYKRRTPGVHEVMSDEVDTQERLLIELLTALGVVQYQAIDSEADDVMGRLARYSKRRPVALYSGDTDLLQLVNDDVRVIASSGGREIQYGTKGVIGKTGVRPRLVAQWKALAGDSSDKIPGAPGIGGKTAAQILSRYESLDSAIEAAKHGDESWPCAERYRKILIDSEDNVRLFLKLTRIRFDRRMHRITGDRDSQAAVVLLKRYKMHSLAFSVHLKRLMRMGRRAVA